jgi:SH3-like domain-containing protein
MRLNWLAGLFVAMGAPAFAADAVVRVPKAEVRGGRSTVFPVTATLRSGHPVHVVREEDNWLAIAPPEGSSSWVMERVLDATPVPGRPTICVVLADDGVPVLLGTPDNAAPLPNVVATLKRGTQVIVTGEKATSDALGDKTTWWRIQPSPNEVRWLAKDAVTPPVASPTSVAKPAGRPGMELWQRAELAERAGNVAQAVVLYRQTAAEQSRPGGDHDLALRASARADALTRGPGGAMTARSPDRAWPAGVLMTSGPGYLRRSAFLIEGQTAFVLESARGYPVVYAIAQPGLSLEPYVNRQVELFGPMVSRPDMATNGYMSVGRLHLLR